MYPAMRTARAKVGRIDHRHATHRATHRSEAASQRQTDLLGVTPLDQVHVKHILSKFGYRLRSQVGRLVRSSA
jgi:hypothetical protein